MGSGHDLAQTEYCLIHELGVTREEFTLMLNGEYIVLAENETRGTCERIKDIVKELGCNYLIKEI